ncbi:alkaline phosphatase family protein [Micromonospora yasonensis]|uniref:alkaline phosphatase family protein n=1 Tax=Micromonospora yasonensis TaxID=1128667 RepID=UPI0022304796|nr:alkaline phosphatase family protein [Micromonospora yasonensis]MCW3842514.1 alkaline phosphatase family protein [Micromonospora yasonensis]
MTDPTPPRRRAGRLVARALLIAGLLALADPAAVAHAAPRAVPGPSPTTPIDHFVFLMQENHTFDNYFGTRPGVDGIPAGTCMPVRRGQAEPCVRPFHLGELGSLDLDHSAEAFRVQYHDGRMDGFVEGVSTQGKNGKLAMAYYDDRDLPYYWNIADEYVLFDRFFSSANSGSIRNHMYRVTGSPGATGPAESIPPGGWGDIPTIFDRLEAAGISWKFYVENYDPTITYRSRTSEEDVDRGAQVIWVPLLAYARYVDDPRLFGKIVDLDQYYEDAAKGQLPAVSFIAPAGDSEHPPGSVRAGQTLVRTLLTQLMRSPNWNSSAFLWSYDDWGGWYDHVPPPQVDRYGYGFRVPALLVSPYARRGYVDSTTLDFTSALKFIEVNWRLKPLAERDGKASTFLDAFDFDRPPRPAVFLGTERKPAVVTRPDPVPVYASYAITGSLVVALVGVAARRRRQWT